MYKNVTTMELTGNENYNNAMDVLLNYSIHWQTAGEHDITAAYTAFVYFAWHWS